MSHNSRDIKKTPQFVRIGELNARRSYIRQRTYKILDLIETFVLMKSYKTTKPGTL
jgi:hypothetical protein